MYKVKANALLHQLKQDNFKEPPIKLSKRNRKPGVAAPGLCDLPTELLQKIVSEVNIFDHSSIRATSKRLRNVSDEFVMHQFKKVLHRHVKLDPTSYGSAIFKIIEYATEVHVRSGFASIFCVCILPIIRSSREDNFSCHACQMENFLLHFYDMVDILSDKRSQRTRLLYHLTLMRLLRFFRKFDKCTIISSTMIPLQWTVVLELRGPWLAIRTNSTYNQSQDNNLLVILSEMLIANVTGNSFKRIWECLSENIFGNETSSGKRVPKTYFTIKVNGPRKICMLLRACLEDPGDAFIWPSKWPKAQFIVNMDIICPEAKKWGCPESHHMEFVPATES